MAFTDLAWTNGDTITEVKLDQMVANDQHVREELNSRVIATCGRYEQGGPGTTVSNNSQIMWYVDSTFLRQFDVSTGYTNQAEANKSISALSAGLHAIRFDIFHAGVVHDSFSFKFERVADLTYLSLWMKAWLELVDGYYFTRITGLTVLGHRTSKSW